MTPRKFKITYKVILKPKTVEITAFSKYDAKKRFYNMFPNATIISIEEVNE